MVTISLCDEFQQRCIERVGDDKLMQLLAHRGDREVAFLRVTADEPDEWVSARVAPTGVRVVEESQAPSSGTLIARGPTEAWTSLLAGERSWAESTNVTLGHIRLSGDPVEWAWLVAPLTRLFETPNRHENDSARGPQIGAHANTSEVSGRYVTVDGVQAYFEHTSGDGPAVLLLHTAGRDGRQWHPVMERLGASHRLYAPDLPGHGKSWPQKPEPCLSDIHDIAAWLLAFMAAVDEPEFIVAGTSVGGNLALLLAAISDRVRGAVAFQGSDHTPTISVTSLSLMDHPRVAVQHSSMDQAVSLVGERAVPEARELIEWSIRELSPLAQRGDLAAYTNTDTRHLMADIRCPVTLVHGDRDWLATREMVDGAASRIINASKLSVLSLPGIGHYPHMEDPGRAAELITQMGQIADDLPHLRTAD